MRQLLYLLFLGCIFQACDDGDVFEVTLDFDQELELCIDANTNDNLLYDTKENPAESLTLLFPINNNSDIFDPPEQNYEKILEIDGSNVAFNYRRYNGSPENLICSVIPDPGTTITEDYPSASGAEAIFFSTYEDEDNDGIPSDLEGRGEQAEDGSYPNALDTDGDGIPDYIDQDDDNDNIPTADEDADPDGDGDPSDALNTDFDAEMTSGGLILPNYLDPDDDGDGTLTINEDEDSNGSPLDDFDEEDADPNTARYLNPNVTEAFDAGEMDTNAYTRVIRVNVTITNANIGIANIQTIEMGTYTLSVPLTGGLQD